MKSHGLSVYTAPPKFLFLSIETFSFPCPTGKLHLNQHGCRPHISIICRSWINLSLLDKDWQYICFRSIALSLTWMYDKAKWHYNWYVKIPSNNLFWKFPNFYFGIPQPIKLQDLSHFLIIVFFLHFSFHTSMELIWFTLPMV